MTAETTRHTELSTAAELRRSARERDRVASSYRRTGTSRAADRNARVATRLHDLARLVEASPFASANRGPAMLKAMAGDQVRAEIAREEAA